QVGALTTRQRRTGRWCAAVLQTGSALQPNRAPHAFVCLHGSRRCAPLLVARRRSDRVERRLRARRAGGNREDRAGALLRLGAPRLVRYLAPLPLLRLAAAAVRLALSLLVVNSRGDFSQLRDSIKHSPVSLTSSSSCACQAQALVKS